MSNDFKNNNSDIFNNHSSVSEGQINPPSAIFSKIENDIQKKDPEKNNTNSSNPINSVPKNPNVPASQPEHEEEVQQLKDFIKVVEGQYNYNLQIANHYMTQVQTLGADLDKTKVLNIELNEALETNERIYQNKIKETHSEIKKLEIQKYHSINRIRELQLTGEMLKKETDIKINEVQQMQTLNQRLNETNEKFSQNNAFLHEKVEILSQENQNMRKDNVKLVLDRNKFENDFLMYQDLYQREQKSHEESKLELKGDIKAHENQKLIEVKLRKQEEFQLQPTKVKLEEREQQLGKVTALVTRLELENQNLQEKLDTIDRDQENYFKSNFQQIYDNHSEEQVSLLARQSSLEEKVKELRKQVIDMDGQLRQAEVQREFFKAENEILETNIKNEQRQKTDHLREFQNLQGKYERAIEDLQNNLQDTQLQLFKSNELNQSLRDAIGIMEQKFENMIEMQNVLKLGHDENTLKVMQQISDLGLPPLSKDELSSAQTQAYNEFQENQNRQMFQEEESLIKGDINSVLFNEIQDRTVKLDNETSQFQSQWDKMFSQLDDLKPANTLLKRK